MHNGPFISLSDRQTVLITSSVTNPSETSPPITASIPISSTPIPPPSNKGLTKYEKIGMIVGSSIGGIITLLLLGAILFICLRHRRRSSCRRYPHLSNELPSPSNKHELPPGPRIQCRRPTPRRFLVELDAGEVAAEKGTGMRTPGFKSQSALFPTELSPASLGSGSAESPPLQGGHYGFPEPNKPPTPPKLIVNPLSWRRSRSGKEVGEQVRYGRSVMDGSR